MFANNMVSGANFRSDAWKIKYTLIPIDNYNLKLIDSIYLITLKAFNFLKFSFSHDHFILKNFYNK